jgi:Spy/CpxP family protein refolding chaperone
MTRLLHRIILLAALLPAMATPLFAQEEDMPPPSDERMKEIKAQKSAYLTTKLELTSEEAQRFWPIYNEYDAQQETLRREMREMHRDTRDMGSMTEAQATALIEKALANRQKELDLERTYSEKFKKSIGAVKTVRLHKAERDFNREVLRRFKERMGERHGDGQPRKKY